MTGILRMLATPAAATDAREQISPMTPTAEQQQQTPGVPYHL
jgi:hypothetical protein